MQLENLRMPPYNTTMMGVLKGVVDYYRLPASAAAVFGVSGHAFLINIHQELCPSSPYCWNRRPFLALVRNLGTEMTEVGAFSSTSSPSERSALESRLRKQLDDGEPCSFLNLENQLITGYDESGFILAQPWHDAPVTPPRLTFGSWSEFGDSVFPVFFSFRKAAPAPARVSITESIAYAIDLYHHPELHAGSSYGVGPNAYDNWIKAVREGHGAGHGNWWNGMVWSECRQMAAAYFDEIAQAPPDPAPTARTLAAEYHQIGEALHQVSDRELPAREKITLLQSARDHENKAVGLLPGLLTQLERHTS